MTCDECGCDCGEHESRRDFIQWQENELCRECNDKGFSEQQAELRGLPR